MNKFLVGLIVIVGIASMIMPTDSGVSHTRSSSSGGSTFTSDIDKILMAKQKVRSIVNYPDTLSFHEFDTNVSGNIVTLKFTCKNAFGVPETNTLDINVR
jgi:hypothetical protein